MFHNQHLYVFMLTFMLLIYIFKLIEIRKNQRMLYLTNFHRLYETEIEWLPLSKDFYEFYTYNLT